ncbi:MAG: GNAT family protein [Anaerovoracaceae bacterium]|mgnify:FL=1|nr:GNAT family N-acetyltransferase [Bacillota bacterium]MEE0517539.1 GNAT family protein [Anaerovoracaceae bacterium]
MNIIGKKIYLRAMELSDMELYRSDVNKPETEHALGGWSFPISSVQQAAWFENAVKDRNNLRLTIVSIENDEILGMVNLVNIDWKSRVAFSGIRLFGEEHRGKGYGKDAVLAIMKYAFEELGLNRIEGSIIETNEASKRLYERCGWKVEGIKREAVYQCGRYYDELQVAVLRKDYELIKETI